VNRSSRKPFYWGGLVGYQQLEAIEQALSVLQESLDESGYFQRLQFQVGRALEKNRPQAHNLAEVTCGCARSRLACTTLRIALQTHLP